MVKSLLLVIGLLSSAIYLNGGENEVRTIADARHQAALLQLEHRKLDLKKRGCTFQLFRAAELPRKRRAN